MKNDDKGNVLNIAGEIEMCAIEVEKTRQLLIQSERRLMEAKDSLFDYLTKLVSAKEKQSV